MTVALPLLVIVPELTVNVADVAVAATMTDADTVSAELEFERLTVAPPVGAGWVRVTVQVLEELDPRLPGLHDSVETNTGARRFMMVLAEVPL